MLAYGAWYYFKRYVSQSINKQYSAYNSTVHMRLPTYLLYSRHGKMPTFVSSSLERRSRP